MRSWSMKSTVTALSIVVTLTFAVPTLEARTAEPRQTVEQRGEPRGIDRVARAVRRVVSRLTGIGTNNWPVPPLPTPTTP